MQTFPLIAEDIHLIDNVWCTFLYIYLNHKHEERWDSAFSCTGFKVWLTDMEFCAQLLAARIVFALTFLKPPLTLILMMMVMVVRLISTHSQICIFITGYHHVDSSESNYSRQTKIFDAQTGMEGDVCKPETGESFQLKGYRREDSDLLYWFPMGEEFSSWSTLHRHQSNLEWLKYTPRHWHC